jgi:S1-C subfamily serine protease/AraC-like DNA-binding protein
MDLSAAAAASWLRTGMFLAGEVDRRGGLLANPLLATDLERILLRGLLLCQPHSYSGLLAAGSAEPGLPGHVAAAVALLEAAPARRVGTDFLARQVNVSTRVLQAGFREHLGMSPTQYLRQLRLRHVHEDLAGSDPAQRPTVAEVAYRWGFSHLGRFAQDYRSRYGERLAPAQRAAQVGELSRSQDRDTSTSGRDMNENERRDDGTQDQTPTWSDTPATAGTPTNPTTPAGHPAPGGYETPVGYTPPAGYAPPAGYPAGVAAPGVAAPPAVPRRRRRAGTAAVAGTLALAVALGGVAIGRELGGSQTTGGSGTAAPGSTTTGQFGFGTNPYGRYGNGTYGNGTYGNGTYGNGGTGNGGTGTGTGTGTGSTSTGTTRSATSTESVGVVDITTVLNYGEGAAAGTGVVLTADGEILTNNHVVADATKITVTVVSTGTSYTAKVVGTDATDDVAVLQLSGASGLSTAKLATTATTVGTAVTAVGNAGGTGGTPTAATGTVLALDQSITATDDSGADAEQLTGLIEVDAAIQAGDSGGPLYAGGAVVGLDTAASSSGQTVGFAIPIATATAIADRIEAGEDSATIQQGTPAFLGVEFATGTTAATIGGVVAGSPAATAGLAAGDTITKVDGTAVTSTDSLSTALGKHDAGDSVRITWTTAAGATHSATVTLVAGPAA